jgi:hypothetical protein
VARRRGEIDAAHGNHLAEAFLEARNLYGIP